MLVSLQADVEAKDILIASLQVLFVIEFHYF